MLDELKVSARKKGARSLAYAFAACYIFRFTQMAAIDSNSVQRSQTSEELHARLAGMNDAELVRFGQGAAHMCTPAKNSTRPIRDIFILQLREARAEWRRRYPSVKCP